VVKGELVESMQDVEKRRAAVFNRPLVLSSRILSTRSL